MKIMEGERNSTFFKYMFVVSAIVFVTPFVLYFYARFFNNLPTKEEWYIGTNHGPWRWELKGYLIALPFVVLIPLSITGGLWILIKEGGVQILSSIVGLVTIQAVFTWGHINWLFWLID